MSRFYDDATIGALVGEPKPLPEDWRARLNLRRKRTRFGPRLKSKLEVRGASGNRFELVVTAAPRFLRRFSVLVTYIDPDTNRTLVLRRYNGWHAPHVNGIEGNEIVGPHIHMATERYQSHGMCRPEHFAVASDRFVNHVEALSCAIEDCGFLLPPISFPSPGLFDKLRSR
jgi:hypothetical protein